MHHRDGIHLAVHGAQVDRAAPIHAQAVLQGHAPHRTTQSRREGVVDVGGRHTPRPGQACKLGAEGARSPQLCQHRFLGLGGEQEGGWVWLHTLVRLTSWAA
jgi:hypothetical protein